jgi:hypothetical protein
VIRSVETDVAVMDSGKAATRSRQATADTPVLLLGIEVVATGRVRDVAKGTVDLRACLRITLAAILPMVAANR